MLFLGTRHGDGVYFAASPYMSGSVVFSPPDSQGNSYIYQARVLIGRTGTGKPGLKEPPLVADSSGRRYDSVSDADGSIYAIFYDAHAYPEYLIIFRKDVFGNHH